MCDHVRMKAELRLLDCDQGWRLGMQQNGQQAKIAEGPIR
jgi:hypothetical protein